MADGSDVVTSNYERRYLAELYAEDDRLRREHAEWREAQASPPVEKSGADVVLYREHETPAAVMASATDDDDDDALDLFDDPQLNRTFSDTVAHIIVELRREWRDAIKAAIEAERVKHERAFAQLQAENVDLKGLITDALSRFAEVNDAAKWLASEIAVLKADKRDRAVRDQTIIERSGRIAELQRENAAKAAELTRQQWEGALAQRDARIQQLETKLGMLLNFIGGNLPRGISGDVD